MQRLRELQYYYEIRGLRKDNSHASASPFQPSRASSSVCTTFSDSIAQTLRWVKDELEGKHGLVDVLLRGLYSCCANIRSTKLANARTDTAVLED